MSEESTSSAKGEVIKLTTPPTNATIVSFSTEHNWSIDQLDWLNNITT
jgi:hypothetical protein